MVTFEVFKRIEGTLMLLRVKLYRDDTVVVNRLDPKTSLPIDSINPKLLGL